MNNFVILIPTFNDWKSLNKLLREIDKNISKYKGKFSVVVVNDASTIKPNLSLRNLKKLKKITLITNKKNLGSQKKYLFRFEIYKKNKKKINNNCNGFGWRR